MNNNSENFKGRGGKIAASLTPLVAGLRAQRYKWFATFSTTAQFAVLLSTGSWRLNGPRSAKSYTSRRNTAI